MGSGPTGFRQGGHWDNGLEPDGQLAVRLGFRQVKSLLEEEVDWIIAVRGNGYPTSSPSGAVP